MTNWDSYRRKQINISKAVVNEEVTKLLPIYYNSLYTELVRGANDIDTFNDTFLKLTHQYNPDKDFREQFVYYFNLLKGAYYRDDYRLIHIADYSNYSEVIEEEVEQKDTNTNFKTDLINALSKESKSNKNKGL